MKFDQPLNRPIRDIHPKAWATVLNTNKLDNAEFRNLQHFKNYCSSITQKKDNMCDVSYAEALNDLLKGKAVLKPNEYESIRNLVRTNLLKRGLISEEVYESYKYDIEGVAFDVSKIIAEDPQCFLAPSYSYTSYFYELYINVSYAGSVSDSHIREQMCKILATIEELEREHIYIKVTLVDCSGAVDNERDLLTVLPLFDYREEKTIGTMSSVLNERLLRKFMFAMSEDIYGNSLSSGYGRPIELPQTIRPIELNEVDLFTSIYDAVIVPGTR